MRKFLLLFITIISFGVQLKSQTPIPLGPQQTTYSGLSRGYFFTAPVSFTICGLFVPPDASSNPSQSVEIVQFTAGPPPAWPGTTNAFNNLFYVANNTSNAIIPCNVTVNAGDVIGVYGIRDCASIVNSYGQANTVTSVYGNNFTLSRSGMQYNLCTQPMHDIWSEVNYYIGRVIMYIDCCPAPISPTNINGPMVICPNSTQTYTTPILTGIVSYNWTFPTGSTINSGQGTTSVNVTFGNTAGQVCVAAQDTCSTSAPYCMNVNFTPTPTSSFNLPLTGCAGQNNLITYTGTGTAAGTYSWNFGGGTVVSGSGMGPYQVSWPSAGSYTVTLSVTENGCTSTVTSNTITINQIPTSTITPPATGCAGQNVTISYGGNASAAGTYNWGWNGGTVVSGSGQGAYQISWPSSGTYNITLTVTENGCTSTQTTQPVTINPVPTSSLTATTPVCSGTPCNVSYTGNAGAAATYNWNFNGATVGSGSGQGPYVVSWPVAGNYNVTIAVTENGCTSNTATQAVVVTNMPTSTFTVTSPICFGQQSNITYTGTGTAGATYNWNFNGGSVVSGSGQGPYVIDFPAPGNYNVTLDVSENGCTSPSTSNAVTVNQIPTSTFTVSDTLICTVDSIVVTYTGNGGAGASFNWSFGAGASILSGTGAGPYTVKYNSPAIYNVSLTVTENGCPGFTDSIHVNVNATPVINVSADAIDGCEPFTVNFSSQSSNGFIYSWDFGDTSTSTIQNPTHTYNAGNYPVSLTVISPAGCSATQPLNNNINVVPQPVPMFSVVPSLNTMVELQSATFNFFNQSQYATIFNWDFGDGIGTSNAYSPTYTYTTVGNYDVTLTAANNLGCSNTISLGQIMVIPNGNIFFPLAFTPNGDGINDVYEIKSFGVSKISFVIFDRWGEKLFEANDLSQTWDGTFQNKPVQGGVYLYYGEADFNNGTHRIYKGEITLLR